MEHQIRENFGNDDFSSNINCTNISMHNRNESQIKKRKGCGVGVGGKERRGFQYQKKKTKFLELQILEKGRRLNEQ